MTSKFFYCLTVVLLSITSCTAQIEILGASKGNTGHRGIVPRDADGNHIEQPKGKDYYAIELKCKKRCNVEIMTLTVKTNEGQTVVLTPNFTENNGKKCKMTTEQVCSIRAERDETATESKQVLTGEGVLKVKINGKIKSVPIENFTTIMPQ
jgi:hypothetical protein